MSSSSRSSALGLGANSGSGGPPVIVGNGIAARGAIYNLELKVAVH